MAVVNVGDKFGSLVVSSLYESKRASGTKKRMASCACACGGSSEVEIYNLRTGNTQRCKQCKDVALGDRKRTHGHTYSCATASDLERKCYYTWQAMKRRCRTKTDKRYPDYGGRGIEVCDAWANSYEAFFDSMGLPPSMDHQIDRADNDGNYEPSNCRWVTRVENSRNKRNNPTFPYQGREVTIPELAELSGSQVATVRARLMRSGWTTDEVVAGVRLKYRTPDGDFAKLEDVCRKYGMSCSGASNRFYSRGYPDWVKL